MRSKSINVLFVDVLILGMIDHWCLYLTILMVMLITISELILDLFVLIVIHSWIHIKARISIVIEFIIIYITDNL